MAARAIHREADEAGVIERLVSLGLFQDRDERVTCRLGIEPFGEVRQRVVSKAAFHAQGPGRRTDQCLDCVEGALT